MSGNTTGFTSAGTSPAVLKANSTLSIKGDKYTCVCGRGLNGDGDCTYCGGVEDNKSFLQKTMSYFNR